MMIWSIAWRNIWRNKLRSSVVITAIALGIFAGVFSMAFMRGMANQRLDSAIKTQVSDIQVHTAAFTRVNEIKNYFTGSDTLLQDIDTIPGVVASSRRIMVNAMINSAEKGSGVKLYGVEPRIESQVTDLHDKVIDGNYLDSLKTGRPILIGQKLARKLSVKTGSKLVVGMLDAHGYPVYYQFRVGGIFKTASTPFDESNAFVRYSDLRKITGLPDNSAHGIAVYLKDPDISGKVASAIRTIRPDLNVREWFQIMPELSYLTETMDYYMYIFIVIILLALGFGIVNTMLMVVLERVKELGMLMAVGMNRRRIFGMIMLETVFLSITGGIAGIMIGTAAAVYFHKAGLNLSGLYGEGFSALGYNSVIYTVVLPQMIVMTAGLVILTGILASIYPALKALKLNPADAIRTDA